MSTHTATTVYHKDYDFTKGDVKPHFTTHGVTTHHDPPVSPLQPNPPAYQSHGTNHPNYEAPKTHFPGYVAASAADAGPHPVLSHHHDVVTHEQRHTDPHPVHSNHHYVDETHAPTDLTHGNGGRDSSDTDRSEGFLPAPHSRHSTNPHGHTPPPTYQDATTPSVRAALKYKLNAQKAALKDKVNNQKHVKAVNKVVDAHKERLQVHQQARKEGLVKKRHYIKGLFGHEEAKAKVNAAADLVRARNSAPRMRSPV